MRVSELTGMAFIGVLLLSTAGDLAAQCQDCGMATKECLDTAHNVLCISWEDDPALGTGCSAVIVPPGTCGGIVYNVDITGRPLVASAVAGPVDPEDGWIRRPCDNAVLRFALSEAQVAWIRQTSERISL